MIVFVSNFMNHHQFGVAKELYRLTNGDYKFIEMEPIPDNFIKSGYPYLSNSPFVLKAWESEDNLSNAKKLIDNAQAVVFGGIQNRNILLNRISQNKLTFEYGERWLKRGFLNIFSPNFLKALWYYKTNFKNKPVFYLCASAFSSKDLNFFGTFKNKCYKFGYFPEKKSLEFNKSENDKLKIISIARLINWKRVDLGIKLAKFLKNKGYKFEYNIFGDGPLKNKLQKKINKYDLGNCVFLRGNIPNDEIQKEMATSDIFVFTSNRREGWGAVLNEAMYNKCAVVVSDKIGSAPYLVRDQQTGLIFKNGNIKDLVSKVEILLKNKNLRSFLGENAYNYINQFWSPEVAAKNILTLIQNLNNNQETSILKGPCSKA